MSINNTISNDLFLKLKGHFPQVRLGNEQGMSTVDPNEAVFFDFDFAPNGEKLANVSISIADQESMKIFYSTDILESDDPMSKKRWFNFLKEMRRFAKSKLLNFEPKDIIKKNLDKRDYEFLSKTQEKTKDLTMSESSLYGSTRSSYQKLENTKLIIRHSKRIEEDSPNSRTRNIDALFIESENGERFKYPFVHLAGARAMQRHVSNGGSPYDDFGQYVVSLSENIYSLRRFNHLVNRAAFLENTDVSGIARAAKNKSVSLKKTLESIQKQKNYVAMKESFQSIQKKEIDSDMLEQLKDRFTLHQFNEELTELFPYITDLLGESGEIELNGDLKENSMSADMYESGNDLDSIINNFRQDVADFKAGGDMSEELFDALYSYYAASGDMPYGVQKGREGDPMDWVSQRFEQELSGSGIDEAQSMHSTPEAALDAVEEWVEQTSRELERTVEWSLTDFADMREVAKLTGPIQAALNKLGEWIEHAKSQHTNSDELEEGPKKADPYDASDAADEPVSDYKGKERDPAYELKMVLDQHPKIQIEEFHKDKIRDMLVHTMKQHKTMIQAAQENPKDKNAKYSVEKVEARLKLMKVRYDSANKATTWPGYIQHLVNSLYGIDNPVARPLANLADDWDTRSTRGTPLIDSEQKKEAINLIKKMISNAEILPIFYGNKEASKEGIAFEDLENLLQVDEENQNTKQESKFDLLKEFEDILDSMIYEESGVLSKDEDVKNQAVAELNKLMPEHFSAGTNGLNAIESLKGIIDDPQLNKQIEELAKSSSDGADACVRPLVMEWIKENAPEIENQIEVGDLEQDQTAAEPAAEPEEEPAVDPAAPTDAAAQPTGEVPPEEEPAAAEDEDEDRLNPPQMTGPGQEPFDLKELAEFVGSFYDREKGTFPPGPEGVVIKVEKKYGPVAAQLAEKLVREIAPHQDSEVYELGRIRELAGL